MKKNLLQLTALSSLLLSAAALASESAEVKVIGEISPISCDVSVDNNGVFDFGKIKQSMLKEDTSTPIGRFNGGSVRVKCSAPTPLTFTTTDNRVGSASSTSLLGANFGLGMVNGTGKLGFYQLKFSEPTVDGVTSYMFAADDGDIHNTESAILAQQGRRMGWAKPNSYEVLMGKEFAFVVNATGYMAPKSEMNGVLTEDVSLDGSTTLEFGFGL